MPINNITQTISELPAAGARGVDVQTIFVIKQEDFQDHLQGTTVTELNTFKDQLNTRIEEINSTATTMNGYVNDAFASASTATTKAGEAATSAGQALTSRNQAETFKNNASTSASTATTKAGEASASALSASTSASTATTKASEASASASSASTSASTATTKASEASASATTATTKASEASASATTASTKASEASTSASQALTSRNQAETFAQQASASASSVDANNIVHRTGDETIAGIKNFSSNIVGNITGNAATATKLATARTINGVAFDGSANITVGGTPVGTIITFASDTVPAGYLKANGALVSRTVYSALFAAIGTTFGVGDGSTTFALPDLRGYFPRGWDDSRGIDASRVFGSLQNDEIKSHTHANGFGASMELSSTTVYSNNKKYVDINQPLTETGGTETRPKNIALLYCIKY